MHHLDFLRATLMLAGIPYHAALAFSGRSWGVTSPESVSALGILADFIHVWRMPTFFIIAGVFATLIAQRAGVRHWIRGRLTRLGIPLIFGLLVISPVQLLLLSRVNANGFGKSSESFDELASSPGMWIGHLWFLVNLIIYCIALAALITKVGSPRRLNWVTRFTESIWSRSAITFVAVASAASVTAVMAGAWHTFEMSNRTLTVLADNFVLSMPFFFIGALVGLRREFIERIASRPRVVTYIVGIVLVVAIVAFSKLLDEWDLPIASLAHVVLITGGGLYAARILIGVAGSLVTNPNRIVNWLVSASLTIYIFHHPLIMLFSSLLFETGVAPALGFLIACVATFISCAAVYEALSLWSFTRLISTGYSKRSTTIFRAEISR
ncbi:acyltransferase family protein [Mycetocola zhadangensis]|nr:acyltransferase family protein [Mycetocola zhadangensis]